MGEDNKKAWCGFNGWQPVAHTYDGAAYMAPIQANEDVWSKIKETISNAKYGEFYVFDSDGNHKVLVKGGCHDAPSDYGFALTIGDTPEQLGTIQASETIMIDGKVVTREDVRKLQSELDALAATVEALRAALQMALPSVYASYKQGLISNKELDEINNADEETPQQHLRDVRAEAVIDAIKSCVVVNCIGTNCISVRGLKQYAERVKAGEA